MCKIFQKSEPETSYERLKRANKKWLLRESRVPGMITLDCIKADGRGRSMRFAHTDAGWLGGVDATQPHEYLSLKNIETHAKALFELLAKEGFLEVDCLVPRSAEQTVASAYLAYNCQSLRFFEGHEDPVSLEIIPKGDLFVGPSGAYFSRKTVLAILAQDKPHDPLTNLAIGPHDFRPIGHIAERIEAKQSASSVAASSSSSASSSTNLSAQTDLLTLENIKLMSK